MFVIEKVSVDECDKTALYHEPCRFNMYSSSGRESLERRHPGSPEYTGWFLLSLVLLLETPYCTPSILKHYFVLFYRCKRLGLSRICNTTSIHVRIVSSVTINARTCPTSFTKFLTETPTDSASARTVLRCY